MFTELPMVEKAIDKVSCAGQAWLAQVSGGSMWMEGHMDDSWRCSEAGKLSCGQALGDQEVGQYLAVRSGSDLHPI